MTQQAALALDHLLQRELPDAMQGDRDAYGRIIAACQNMVSAIALAITRDTQASQDIAQETFLRGWSQLRQLHNPTSFLPWLRQITRNLARDHQRGDRKRPLSGESAELAMAMAADPDLPPDQQLIADERRHAARELICALPDDSREVLLLFYREGGNSQQVANLLGLSDSAVRKRLSRARAAVRADLLERFGEFACASAPGIVFTNTTSQALPLAFPPLAGKPALGTSGAVGAKGLAYLSAGAAAGLVIGGLAALGGVWLGLRRDLKLVFDDEERRGLIRIGVINSLAVIGFLIAMVLIASSGFGGWCLPTLLVFVYVAVVIYQKTIVLERVIARRRALEQQRDAEAFARLQRRRRLVSIVGSGIGAACALAGLIAGLAQSGRLPAVFG